MLSYIHDVLREAELSSATRADAFSRLRTLGFEDFGEILLNMPMAEYPLLSALLPRMASEEAQLGWTGGSGYPLLALSSAFVRSLAHNYARFGSKPIGDSKVLDYGCGYGRIARLMYYMVDEPNFWGVDPWDRSIDECRQAGLKTNIVQSEFLPTSLPVGDVSFDLMYSFSIFTHLSENAFHHALGAMRKHISADGVAVITTRPPEFWDQESLAPADQRQAMAAAHAEKGFAFLPVGFESNGETTYGHTSMSLEWLDANLRGWKRVAIDRHLNDYAQIYVVLKPV